MDFHQLRYFNSLAFTENMSKSAQLLNVSQPTLSKSIAKLEEEVGCPLFDRNGKNIKLNASGRAFMEYSVKCLELLDTGVKQARHVEQPGKHRVRLCISGGCDDMIKCIARFQTVHPEIVFDMDEVLDYETPPEFNQYDLMICPDSLRYKEYEGQYIGKDKMCLCVGAKHPLANKIAVSPKDLSGLDVVFLKKGDYVETVQWGLEALSIKPKNVYYVNSRDLHRQLISEGVVAGYVLESIAKLYESDGSIKVIPILDVRFCINMKLVVRKEKHLSESAILFRDFAYEYFGLNKEERK